MSEQLQLDATAAEEGDGDGWHTFHYRPHARDYRFRYEGVNQEGYPYGLELERWTGAVEEWTPVANHNTRDAFKMGWMQARASAEHTE